MLAGFATCLVFTVLIDKLNFENVRFSFVAFVDLVGNVLAIPGLCLFLIWSWSKWRSGRPFLPGYIAVGFLLALLNGAGVVCVIDNGRITWGFAIISLFFGVTGALTAAIHWRIMRYWTSPAVTLFRESARKEWHSLV